MLVTLDAMKDYLGESGTVNDNTIMGMIASAEEELTRATGLDWGSVEKNQTAQEACRIMVWRSFFAARDISKNTEFLEKRLVNLMTMLQYGSEQNAQIQG